MSYHVNAHQTPDERRAKYARLRAAGFNSWFARRARDWTASHVTRQIDAWASIFHLETSQK
jgi:hypothetical protein